MAFALLLFLLLEIKLKLHFLFERCDGLLLCLNCLLEPQDVLAGYDFPCFLHLLHPLNLFLQLPLLGLELLSLLNQCGLMLAIHLF